MTVASQDVLFEVDMLSFRDYRLLWIEELAITFAFIEHDEARVAFRFKRTKENVILALYTPRLDRTCTLKVQTRIFAP